MTWLALVRVSYPVGESLAAVRRAGGVSRMSQADRASLEWRHVEPGQACEGLPASSVPGLLAAGAIVAADEDEG